MPSDAYKNFRGQLPNVRVNTRESLPWSLPAWDHSRATWLDISGGWEKVLFQWTLAWSSKSVLSWVNCAFFPHNLFHNMLCFCLPESIPPHPPNASLWSTLSFYAFPGSSPRHKTEGKFLTVLPSYTFLLRSNSHRVHWNLIAGKCAGL